MNQVGNEGESGITVSDFLNLSLDVARKKAELDPGALVNLGDYLGSKYKGIAMNLTEFEGLVQGVLQDFEAGN
jgi:hypothetical protein